jgi:hypothetical protein
MSTSYRLPPSRTPLARPIALADDFMNWLLYGRETWLLALLKGVPLFLYVYFLLTYVPNYVYYLSTQYIPFLKFTDDVGFLLAAMIGGGNFIIVIIFALWTQAARGRRGFWWSFIRILDFLQYVGIVLLLIPLLLFNLGGGTFVATTPAQAENMFPLQALVLLGIGFLLGLAGLGYLFMEYRRIMRRDALEAEAAARAAAYSAG